MEKEIPEYFKKRLLFVMQLSNIEIDLIWEIIQDTCNHCWENNNKCQCINDE